MSFIIKLREALENKSKSKVVSELEKRLLVLKAHDKL